MRKPYFNMIERQLIYNDTFTGAVLMVRLRLLQLIKAIIKK